MLRNIGFKLIQSSKSRLRDARLLRRFPWMHYTYALDGCSAIVIPKFQFAFVPIPKVANRSIKAAVAQAWKPDFQGDPHLAGWPLMRVETLPEADIFAFGFVRNPFDRLWSLYSQKIVSYGRKLGQPLIFWRYGDRFWPEMSFAEFVQAIAKIPDRISDQHFRSQHCWFFSGEKQLVTFIGRFETLESGWETVRQELDAPLPRLAHWNRTVHTPWTEAYSLETAELAAERYRDDIRRFGYTNDVEQLMSQLRAGGSPGSH